MSVGNQSRRYWGFGGLSPPKSYKSPKIEIWNTNQRIFFQILECQSPLHKRSLPIEDRLVMVLLVTNKGKE